jgi:tRNA/tmRNA/rRNA uracil-C5-methylase (TrmA/RlmC/RlmD family)
LSAQRGDRPEVVVLAGRPSIADTLELSTPSATAVTLGRDVRAFFQSNRFLVERLARHVVDLVPHGPVVDLYAGVGCSGWRWRRPASTR